MGIGWSELLVVAFVGLVLISPNDIPRACYNLGKLVRKFREFTYDFNHSLDAFMAEEELREASQKKANKENKEDGTTA